MVLLDIYLLRNPDEVPNYPDESLYLGSLKLEHHKALDPLWQLCEEKNVQLKYFEDSYLNYQQVLTMLECIKEFSELENSDIKFVKEAYDIIRSIIEKAVNERYGVASFCD